MQEQEKSFFRRNWLSLTLTILMAIFMGTMVYLMTRPGQTPRESALEAVILSAASIVASFLITKIYAEVTYGQSLRDHGVQIASGIMVLKRQIEGLANWVNQKRDSMSESDMSYESADFVLEHVEQTLQGFRGMTEAALGGIAGVIGDALAQYETIMEQISNIRLEALQKTTRIQREMQVAASSQEMAVLQAQIDEIRLQTEKRISQLARSSALPIPDTPPKQVVSAQCPNCYKENSFEMIDRTGETRVIACQYCKRAFNAHTGQGNKVVTRQLFSTRIGNYSPSSKGSELQIKIQQVLVATKAWIEATDLRNLTALVAQTDQEMRQAGALRSPYLLQLRLIEKSEQLQRLGLSVGMVRVFLKVLYQSRTFQFEPGGPHYFKGVYRNDLIEKDLIKAFVRGCIFRVYRIVPVTILNVPEIAELLLGDSFPDREIIVTEALVHFSSIHKTNGLLQIDESKRNSVES